ncbi:MAG: molybdopterin-dependent oxidoreductase [Peptococcaceae bacterium]|nr:molybdopterin-dependent oxidoreductase [Peptococcaceae bacterium]
MLKKERITRHVCPRNCYDTCAILAQVRNGRIVNITGDPAHGYTRGKLCAKGYSYLRRVYSPDRIKQPLRQCGRGSGHWVPVSWDYALEMICQKILDLKHRYGSTLPVCLNKYSGNFGLLNNAIEGLFNQLGPTTQVLGSPCWSAGLDAQTFDFGNNYNSNPENLRKAGLILLWGVNPVWTAVHSLPYIYEAQKEGAKVITIDPIFSETAKKSDLYFQVRPGQDGYLALALAKIIVEAEKEDKQFLQNYSLGWDEFREYLKSLNLNKLSRECGLNQQAIKFLAGLLINHSPVFIWVGFGMQRYANGGQNVRAIDALGALTGNLGKAGGGVHYANLRIWNMFKFNFHKTGYKNRYLNINRFAEELNQLQEPPVKMLWIANRNLFLQDANLRLLYQAIKEIELIITIEEFMTESTKYSDLVLPTTTFFEETDVVPGYWHHWLALNEQAVPPLHEARSDLDIALMVSCKMNSLEQGSCTFPQSGDASSFLDREFDDQAYSLLGIRHWSDLKDSPAKVNIPDVCWEDRIFETPSGKFEFYSQRAEQAGHPLMPALKEQRKPAAGKYDLRLLSPHSQHSINSQFQNLDWIKAIKPEPAVLIHPDTALLKSIVSGSMVRILNDYGEIVLKAAVSGAVPRDVLVCYQGIGDLNINRLLSGENTDMGSIVTGNHGLAILDTFVDIENQTD